MKIALSPGQTHEMKLAYELLGDVVDAYVAADRSYDAGPLVELLRHNKCEVLTPSNSTRAGLRGYDRHLYREFQTGKISRCSFDTKERRRQRDLRTCPCPSVPVPAPESGLASFENTPLAHLMLTPTVAATLDSRDEKFGSVSTADATRPRSH